MPSSETNVNIYTDGACKGNPGPGGYGVLLTYGKHRKELSAGYTLTTNNRMELMACIAGLRALKRACAVNLHSDSKYVVHAITRHWTRAWQRRGWKLKSGDPVKNRDLWEELLELCELHKVNFIWVKGHAGHRENERCDVLATSAAGNRDLAEDLGYTP